MEGCLLRKDEMEEYSGIWGGGTQWKDVTGATSERRSVKGGHLVRWRNAVASGVGGPNGRMSLWCGGGIQEGGPNGRMSLGGLVFIWGDTFLDTRIHVF